MTLEAAVKVKLWIIAQDRKTDQGSSGAFGTRPADSRATPAHRGFSVSGSHFEREEAQTLLAEQHARRKRRLTTLGLAA